MFPIGGQIKKTNAKNQETLSFPSHVSRRWTHQETLFSIATLPKGGQTRKHCFLAMHVSRRWTNQETLFPVALFP
jgi:hypothetical protein